MHCQQKIWNTCLTIVEPVVMIRFLYITGYHSSSVTCQNANSSKIEKMLRVGFGASINFLMSFEAIFVFRLWWQLKKIDWAAKFQKRLKDLVNNVVSISLHYRETWRLVCLLLQSTKWAADTVCWLGFIWYQVRICTYGTAKQWMVL